MCFKLKSENKRKLIAVVSTIVSIAFIVINYETHGNLILTHIGLLQLVASILLLIGTVNDNRWFFLPWLVIAFLFAYTLLFGNIIALLDLVENDDSRIPFEGIYLLFAFIGFWFYFIHEVYVDFRDMRTRPINIIV